MTLWEENTLPGQNTVTLWKRLWEEQAAAPVVLAQFSPDGRLFATAGQVRQPHATPTPTPLPGRGKADCKSGSHTKWAGWAANHPLEPLALAHGRPVPPGRPADQDLVQKRCWYAHGALTVPSMHSARFSPSWRPLRALSGWGGFLLGRGGGVFRSLGDFAGVGSQALYHFLYVVHPRGVIHLSWRRPPQQRECVSFPLSRAVPCRARRRRTSTDVRTSMVPALESIERRFRYSGAPCLTRTCC